MAKGVIQPDPAPPKPKSASPRASTRTGATISYGPAPCVCSRTPLPSLRNEISRDRHFSEKVSPQPAPSMFTRHPHSRQVNRTELEHLLTGLEAVLDGERLPLPPPTAP